MRREMRDLQRMLSRVPARWGSGGGDNEIVLVKITAALARYGLYDGYIWTPATDTLNTTSASATTEALLGTQSTTRVVIFNAQEIGASTHDLTDAGNTNQKIFGGQFWPTPTDLGRPLVVINGVWLDPC